MIPYSSDRKGILKVRIGTSSDSRSWFSVYFILWEQKSNLHLNEQHSNNILAKIDPEFLVCFNWGSKHFQGHQSQSSCMSSAAPFTFGEFMRASYYKLNSPENSMKTNFFLSSTLWTHFRIQTVFMNVLFSRYKLRGRICFCIT